MTLALEAPLKVNTALQEVLQQLCGDLCACLGLPRSRLSKEVTMRESHKARIAQKARLCFSPFQIPPRHPPHLFIPPLSIIV